MNPNDLHQLWDDALDDVPTQTVAEPLWRHVQQALRAERRRRLLVRASALAAAMLIALTAWRTLPITQNELGHDPQPTPQLPVIPTTVVPSELSLLATTPPASAPVPEPMAPQHVVLESVPLKEFLAQLPHHGFVEIKNERGRFLVVVDNETGETFTTVLSNGDSL